MSPLLSRKTLEAAGICGRTRLPLVDEKAASKPDLTWIWLAPPAAGCIWAVLDDTVR